MTTFKRKSVHAAVLAGLGAAAMAGSVGAVQISPTGRGSVLIYPYYTTRADGGATGTTPTNYYDDYISVVNVTAATKALKVRVLEGKRGAEVLSFNLFLSPYDVWAGAIVRTADGAAMISSDLSCVVPNALFAKVNPATIITSDLNHFKNFVYANSGDGGGTTLDRTREGYLEIIEMGVVTNTTATAAARHNSAGVPANCAYFEANDPESAMMPKLTAPTGGLKGRLSLVNVSAGTDYAYDAIALSDWYAGAPAYTSASSTLPRLTTGNVFTSTVVTEGGNFVTSTWTSSRDAVSAVLMREALMNELMLETNTASGTDWVVTFPSKSGYVGVGGGAAAAPFTANFNNGQSCDVLSLNVWNREEGAPTVATSNALCYQANVLTFASSRVLGSTNEANLNLTPAVSGGWAALNFKQPWEVLRPLSSTINGTAAAPQEHGGLPAVGFAVQDFRNGILNGVLSAYGSLFTHRHQIRVGTSR